MYYWVRVKDIIMNAVYLKNNTDGYRNGSRYVPYTGSHFLALLRRPRCNDTP